MKRELLGVLLAAGISATGFAQSVISAKAGTIQYVEGTVLLDKQPVEVTINSKSGAEAQQYSMHSFGAVFTEAHVDESLGIVRLPRIVTAHGVGKILNEKTARSQIIGGVVWGIGLALTEETLIDPRAGRYVNADLAEYHLPVNADVGTIDVNFVDEKDPYVNPIGAKGVGESTRQIKSYGAILPKCGNKHSRCTWMG